MCPLITISNDRSVERNCAAESAARFHVLVHQNGEILSAPPKKAISEWMHEARFPLPSLESAEPMKAALSKTDCFDIRRSKSVQASPPHKRSQVNQDQPGCALS